MPIHMRRAYLSTIRERYQNAPKRQKKNILDEFCSVCGYSRKYAIRILNGSVEPRTQRPGPKPTYGPDIALHLATLWNAMNRMCSKKMVVALPLWLDFYKEASWEQKELLKKVSASTIDRLLRPVRSPLKKGKSTTSSASMIKSRIPIQLLDAEVTEPGFVEADTVSHCGDSAIGPFMSSLTITDLFSGWTENRAVWTKTAEGITAQVAKIEEVLPFMLTGFACDSGSEFINETLENHLKHRLRPVRFVRRRPYKKNDNAHVEQKNWTHVRGLFGYDRLDDPSDVLAMNEIYRAFWNPLWNFFTPVMKLKSKTKIGGKYKKTYDTPKTPYQRLLDHLGLLPHMKKKLRLQFEGKNPFSLKKELDLRLKEFFKSVERRRARPTGS